MKCSNEWVELSIKLLNMSSFTIIKPNTAASSNERAKQSKTPKDLTILDHSAKFGK